MVNLGEIIWKKQYQKNLIYNPMYKMKKEERERCPSKAEYVYPWAGKLMKGCEKHSKAMNVLASFMGSPIEFQKINTDERCQYLNDLEDL